MFKSLILNFIQSEIFYTIILIIIGIILSKFWNVLKAYVKKTPNKVDDFLLNCVITRIFDSVEFDDIKDIAKKNNISLESLNKLNKAEKALEIFKVVYENSTGENASNTIIEQAQNSWDVLAKIEPRS